MPAISSMFLKTFEDLKNAGPANSVAWIVGYRPDITYITFTLGCPQTNCHTNRATSVLHKKTNLVFPNLIAAGASIQVPVSPRVHPAKLYLQTVVNIPHSFGVEYSLFIPSTANTKVKDDLQSYPKMFYF